MVGCLFVTQKAPLATLSEDETKKNEFLLLPFSQKRKKDLCLFLGVVWLFLLLFGWPFFFYPLTHDFF